MEYQNVKETQYFDVANLSNYDLILGTLFLFQRSVLLGFNEARVIVGSSTSLEIKRENTSRLAAHATQLVDDNIDDI